jgi:2-amino-4-hydroxy-6-hydroxymethyldihydropteridine diphosphokinase
MEMRVGVALGSNLGDRLSNLRGARKAILVLSGVTPPILSSSIYETDPVDCEPDAHSFLNAVIEFGYDGDPVDLLRKLKELEAAHGRSPDHMRNVSREIDIDLLYFGENKVNNEKLQLPHPRMHSRRFVLQPLADIRPDLVLPNQTKTIRELLALADGSAKVLRLTSDWT